MAKEEIIAGLENAVARGESIEKAIQSMISAGYSPDEVKDASGYVNMGTIGKINAPEIQQTEAQEIQSAYAREQTEEQAGQPAAEQAAQYQKLPSSSSLTQVQEKPKSKKKTWIIVLAILLLLIVGGIISLMIFGEAILSAFFPKVV